MRISDWSSDVCSSDLVEVRELGWSARHAQRLKHIDIASGSERNRRFHPAHHRKLHPREIGRASGRERVCQYVSIPVDADQSKKQNKHEKTREDINNL